MLRRVSQPFNRFRILLFFTRRTKKVIYSLSWSKEDLSSAAAREVPMTKEVVESLTALGKLHIAITPSPLDSYLLKSM